MVPGSPPPAVPMSAATPFPGLSRTHHPGVLHSTGMLESLPPGQGTWGRLGAVLTVCAFLALTPPTHPSPCEEINTVFIFCICKWVPTPTDAWASWYKLFSSPHGDAIKMWRQQMPNPAHQGALASCPGLLDGDQVQGTPPFLKKSVPQLSTSPTPVVFFLILRVRGGTWRGHGS